MTAGFATALGQSRLCSWPEIRETKMPGKGRNHITILRASRAIPSQCAQCALTCTRSCTMAVWKIYSVQKQRNEWLKNAFHLFSSCMQDVQICRPVFTVLPLGHRKSAEVKSVTNPLSMPTLLHN